MPAEKSPSQDGVAGVRLANGRLAFVRGAPCDLPVGARVRIRRAEGEQAGTLHIPPALLVWCDPALPLGDYLGVADFHDGDAADPAPGTPEAGSATGAIAWLTAPEGAPDLATRAAMITLAQVDLARLDDVPSGPVRHRSGDAG